MAQGSARQSERKWSEIPSSNSSPLFRRGASHFGFFASTLSRGECRAKKGWCRMKRREKEKRRTHQWCPTWIAKRVLSRHEPHFRMRRDDQTRQSVHGSLPSSMTPSFSLSLSLSRSPPFSTSSFRFPQPPKVLSWRVFGCVRTIRHEYANRLSIWQSSNWSSDVLLCLLLFLSSLSHTLWPQLNMCDYEYSTFSLGWFRVCWWCICVFQG